jgi:hypothetical protein
MGVRPDWLANKNLSYSTFGEKKAAKTWAKNICHKLGVPIMVLTNFDTKPNDCQILSLPKFC